jgi:hypothetical protein
MDDDPARSVDLSNQKTRELENETRGSSTEIQASDSRERLRLLANELNQALWRMDDLERELHDLRHNVPLFFQL